MSIRQIKKFCTNFTKVYEIKIVHKCDLQQPKEGIFIFNLLFYWILYDYFSSYSTLKQKSLLLQCWIMVKKKSYTTFNKKLKISIPSFNCCKPNLCAISFHVIDLCKVCTKFSDLMDFSSYSFVKKSVWSKYQLPILKVDIF